MHLDMRSISIWLSAAAALLLAWLLYPEGRSDKIGNATLLTLWTPMDPGVYDPMKPLIEEFERRNPDYRVQLGTMTRNAEGDPTRFLLGVAGGMPPDLIYFDRFAVVEWASRGAFTDLTPYLERDAGRPDAIREENFYSVAWEEPVYRGKNFAIANTIDTRALYYCKDPLIRAGFVYTEDDPHVLDGIALPGDARPPQSWEEVCHKLAHLDATVDADGTVNASAHVRRVGVNRDLPQDAPLDLTQAGVRRGDVVALVRGGDVFRGRVASIDAPRRFRLELEYGDPTDAPVPVAFRGPCEVKLYDQDSYVCRLTRIHPESGQLTTVAFSPLFGNSWLYMFGWMNGGEFMAPGGETCTLDDPRIVEALQWVTDVYDAMGGYEKINVFTNAAKAGGMDPFLTSKIVMRIDSNEMIGYILALNPKLRFGLAPAPIPEARLAAGHHPIGWSGGWAYGIPATAHHKDGAWELLRWLSSLEANKLLVEYQAAISRSKGQGFFPRAHPDPRVMRWVRENYIEDNRTIPPAAIAAFDVIEQLLPNSKYRPVTPVGQKLWNEHVRATEAAVNHASPPYEALNYGTRRVQQALDNVLNPPQGPVVNWPLVISGYVGFVLLLFAGLIGLQEYRRRKFGLGRAGWYEGYIAASPWLFGMIVFISGPILFSLIISFCHYDVLNPARFIGLDNYRTLLGRHYDEVVGEVVWNDPIFWKSLLNTIYMAIGVPLGIVVGLGIALLLDTKVRGLPVYRTIYFLPSIVPAVATFILWLWIFNPSMGLINTALRFVGVDNPPNWLQDPVWAKPALIIMALWGAGGSLIIWLAGLKDIPESLYEAASIDGATAPRRFLHITLPLLTPYIFFNLVMGLIATFQIFDQAYIMTAGGPADSTLFYAYKLFNESFSYLNMGIASAMAWFLFLAVLLITLAQFWLGKKWVHYGG